MGSTKKKTYRTERMYKVDDAIAYGTDEAIVLDQIRYWVASKKEKCEDEFQNRHWTHCTLDEFCKWFPEFSRKQLRRIIGNLVKNEAILRGEFNKHWSDRTSWYTTTDNKSFSKRFWMTGIDSEDKR